MVATRNVTRNVTLADSRRSWEAHDHTSNTILPRGSVTLSVVKEASREGWNGESSVQSASSNRLYTNSLEVDPKRTDAGVGKRGDNGGEYGGGNGDSEGDKKELDVDEVVVGDAADGRWLVGAGHGVGRWRELQNDGPTDTGGMVPGNGGFDVRGETI